MTNTLRGLVTEEKNKALGLRRSFLAAQWLVDICIPAWLDAAGLQEEADQIREAGFAAASKYGESRNSLYHALVAATKAAEARAVVAARVGTDLAAETRYAAYAAAHHHGCAEWFAGTKTPGGYIPSWLVQLAGNVSARVPEVAQTETQERLCASFDRLVGRMQSWHLVSDCTPPRSAA